MIALDPKFKSHLIQKIRKNEYVLEAKWFGTTLHISFGACWYNQLQALEKLIGKPLIELSEGCSYEWCDCGHGAYYVADFRTKLEKASDYVLGFSYGPKGWKV